MDIHNCCFIRNWLAIMDIHNWIVDIHNSIMDIHSWIMEIHNSITDIHNSIMDIHNSIMDIHNHMLAITHNCIMGSYDATPDDNIWAGKWRLIQNHTKWIELSVNTIFVENVSRGNLHLVQERWLKFQYAIIAIHNAIKDIHN